MAPKKRLTAKQQALKDMANDIPHIMNETFSPVNFLSKVNGYIINPKKIGY